MKSAFYALLMTGLSTAAFAEDCGDVTSMGKCDGSVLSFCNYNGQLVTRDCATQSITGQFTYECKEISASFGYECKAECGEITSRGTCIGDVAVFCKDSEFGLDEMHCPYGCTNGECNDPPAHGCGSVTYEGICENGVITYCLQDTLQTIDCRSKGGCGLVNGVYSCLEGDDDDDDDDDVDCEGETKKGRCEGNVVVFCGSTGVLRLPCKDGLVCGENEEGIMDCVEPAAEDASVTDAETETDATTNEDAAVNEDAATTEDATSSEDASLPEDAATTEDAAVKEDAAAEKEDAAVIIADAAVEEDSSSGSDDGCSSAPGKSAAPVILALFALFGFRRRR